MSVSAKPSCPFSKTMKSKSSVSKLVQFNSLRRMTQRLHKAVLVARNAARQKAAKMNREELMSLSKKRSTK